MTPTREEMRRALEARHGAELQARFDAGRVAVCGLGGLGSNAAIALARAGVGHLHLIDFDRVDLSNLNRQQYTAGQLGQYKTDALRDTLGQIAPYCAVRTDTLRVTEENLADLLAEDEIICECFDRAEAKAMLVSGVLERFPEKLRRGAGPGVRPGAGVRRPPGPHGPPAAGRGDRSMTQRQLTAEFRKK